MVSVSLTLAAAYPATRLALPTIPSQHSKPPRLVAFVAITTLVSVGPVFDTLWSPGYAGGAVSRNATWHRQAGASVTKEQERVRRCAIRRVDVHRVICVVHAGHGHVVVCGVQLNINVHKLDECLIV